MVEHTGPPPRNKFERGAVILPAGNGACSFPLEEFFGPLGFVILAQRDGGRTIPLGTQLPPGFGKRGPGCCGVVAYIRLSCCLRFDQSIGRASA